MTPNAALDKANTLTLTFITEQTLPTANLAISEENAKMAAEYIKALHSALFEYFKSVQL